jgi:hypothetical protein
MDQQDHPLDHLLPEESIVPIMVDDIYLKILVVDHKYNIYHIHIYDHKSDRNKSHEVLQLVAVEMEVWTAPEVPMKDPLQT